MKLFTILFTVVLIVQAGTITLKPGKTIGINKSNVTFVAYQFFNRGGIPDGIGPSKGAPQALIRIDSDYFLHIAGDTILSSSFAAVIDSIHLSDNNVFVSISQININGRVKNNPNRITLVDIGNSATFKSSNTSINYILVKPRPGVPYHYNIAFDSNRCPKDTIVTFVEDAGTTICGYNHVLLWNFAGYKRYVSYEKRHSVFPEVVGVSFYIQE